MEAASTRNSAFVGTTQMPLPRHAPLAPSQEIAYREKCIALKRRLMEIESNNDNLRRRLEREKRFQDKMRLNRAILLNHLKEMMETPDRKRSQQELNKIASLVRDGGNLAEHMGYDSSENPRSQGPNRREYLDDSTEESEEDLLPERQEQQPNNDRSQTSFAASAPGGPANVLATISTSAYHQSSLPSLAPAQSYSPAAPQDPAILTSSFRVGSVNTAGPPLAGNQYLISQSSSATPSFSHLQSPSAPQPLGTPVTSIVSPGPTPLAPSRPPFPYDQFTAHMTPQLLNDNLPHNEMSHKIRELWDNMTPGDRDLWDQRYQEQMVDYERAMDEWKRAGRRAR